ncbi:hypothetical protein QCA50_002152 [Cerrena zonata]|uniref:N-acetyltransferase domain-containing protein n=1 Tax=Cerrena zonata TaxID=2478898 RepID=A0AAW0GT00_9APHY
MAAPYHVDVYTSALRLPKMVWDTFSSNPRSANIMYPHALKCHHLEDKGRQPAPDQFWIVCCTGANGSNMSVDFVLSCTRGPLGNYPIFIFTTVPHTQLDSNAAVVRISALVDHLSAYANVKRVFSVFAPELLARVFASIWTERKGIPLDPVLPEYYAAKLTYCNRESFNRVEPPLYAGYLMRLANESDIPKVAPLCHGFSAESAPFVLTHEEARKEATFLVNNQQLWVHCVSTPGNGYDIACIVAVTRTSDEVAAITKVYTNPAWRARGCAERLVRRVCKELLDKKRSVVLFVGHDNPAARVYERVGFVGLSRGAQGNIPGVERWLELGFDRSCVTLGHW